MDQRTDTTVIKEKIISNLSISSKIMDQNTDFIQHISAQQTQNSTLDTYNGQTSNSMQDSRIEQTPNSTPDNTSQQPEENRLINLVHDDFPEILCVDNQTWNSSGKHFL
ncbi:unnamed protein product [Adineta steineri]|uniref:Uncharacterized protein n=1 Tax=Adineta steineri TaxID=433720 RepID=A0A814I251_9BILA|nr:unnamed protein product [Adineta steineri]CAF1008542.1 unnamed protein product [Adineta steineri]CAF1017853.1 unnamed protein product [Adineta steineri]